MRISGAWPGGEDSLAAAADDTWTQFDLGLSNEVKNLGAVKTPSTETLLASQPDFVLGSTKTAADVELLDMLDSMGIPGACFDVSSFDDYLRLLDICTQITGDEEAYETYGVKVQEQIDDARERAARARGGDAAPSVLYIRATGSSCKVKGSQGTVLGEMLADLGCVNVADSETALLEELSLETILAADPDYIFAVLQGADNSDAQAMLEGNPALQSRLGGTDGGPPGKIPHHGPEALQSETKCDDGERHMRNLRTCCTPGRNKKNPGRALSGGCSGRGD